MRALSPQSPSIGPRLARSSLSAITGIARTRARCLAFLSLAILAVLILTLISSSTGLAHALPVRSRPPSQALVARPPTNLQIWFDEALTPSGSSISVYNARRQEVDRGNSRVDPANPKHLTVGLKPSLPDGDYTVAWLSISADDGHHVHGTFTFTVGVSAVPGAASTSNGTPSAPVVALRWLDFLGLMTVAGWFLMVLLGETTEGRHRSWVAAIVAAAVALVSDVILVPAEAYYPGAGLPPQSISNAIATLPSPWRWRLEIEFVLVFAVAISLPIIRRFCHFGRDGAVRLLGMSGALLTGAAVVSIALSSHLAARSTYRVPALAVESLHLESVAFWLGGVVMLVALPRLRKVGSNPTPRRFSRLALGLAPVAVVSGAGVAAFVFPSVASVWQSGYGHILLIKAGLVIGIFAFAWFNHRAVLSGIKRVARFGRTLRGEAIFGIGVILAASVLSLSAPPVPKHITPLDLAYPSGHRQMAHLMVHPVEPGLNQIQAWLTGTNNRVVPGVTSIQVNASMLDRPVDISNKLLPFKRLPNNHWAGSISFDPQGWWEIQLQFQIKNEPITSSEFIFLVPDPNRTGETPSRSTEPGAQALYNAAIAKLMTLKSERAAQHLADGAGSEANTSITYASPTTFAYTNGSAESISIGETQYFRTGNGTWSKRRRASVFHFPATVRGYYTGAKDLTLGRKQMLDGEECRIVTFYVSGGGSRGQAWYAWWVGSKSHLIRREVMVATGHYMIEDYFDFNAQTHITAPPVAQK